MSSIIGPSLSQGNLIYLYRLLSSTIGCGKQTFVTAVEEALASDRMTADDLGFESTRALLEALDSFVVLKVFKGGRIYAIVREQPLWDEALAACDNPEQTSGKNATKPWKKKKGDRALKPVRPKRVKKADQKPAVECASGSPASTSRSDSAREATSTSHPQSARVTTPEPELASVPAASPEPQTMPTTQANATEQSQPTQPVENAPQTEAPNAPSPAISLTVTYDPYTGVDQEVKLESQPVIPEKAGETSVINTQVENTQVDLRQNVEPAAQADGPHNTQPLAAPQDKSTPQDEVAPVRKAAPTGEDSALINSALESSVQSTEPDMPSKAALDSYPKEFRNEVYCPMDIVAELGCILPYGVNTLGTLDEDYARACALELRRGNRSHVTFPLRTEHLDSTDPIRITLQKRSGAAMPWILKSFE